MHEVMEFLKGILIPTGGRGDGIAVIGLESMGGLYRKRPGDLVGIGGPGNILYRQAIDISCSMGIRRNMVDLLIKFVHLQPFSPKNVCIYSRMLINDQLILRLPPT